MRTEHRTNGVRVNIELVDLQRCLAKYVLYKVEHFALRIDLPVDCAATKLVSKTIDLVPSFLSQPCVVQVPPPPVEDECNHSETKGLHAHGGTKLGST